MADTKPSEPQDVNSLIKHDPNPNEVSETYKGSAKRKPRSPKTKAVVPKNSRTLRESKSVNYSDIKPRAIKKDTKAKPKPKSIAKSKPKASPKTAAKASNKRGRPLRKTNKSKKQ